ncbi:MAG: ABC transporter ATP-binding protein [Planctomycetaceae bacterium]
MTIDADPHSDPADREPAIAIRDLVKHYRGSDGQVVRAVNGISMEVGYGETVGLLGANGAGKTTTLRLIATLLAPTAGSITVAGCDTVTDPIGVRRQLGYLSASTGVPDRLTARETVRSYGRLHGLAGDVLERSVNRVVDVLDLGAFADRPCGRISSGQRQRVSLARALVHNPPVIVLDEPTSALDIVASRELLDFLGLLRVAGHAVLLSTHRLHEIERRCNRFVVLHEGHVVAAGTKESLGGDEGGDLEAAYFRAISTPASDSGGTSP